MWSFVQAKEQQYIQILFIRNVYIFLNNNIVKIYGNRRTGILQFLLFKKITNRTLLHSVRSSLIYFNWELQREGIQIQICCKQCFIQDFNCSSASLSDGGHVGSSRTSSSSLQPSSTISTGYGIYSLTISSIDNGRDSLVATSLSK